jgi:hypothetical protein
MMKCDAPGIGRLGKAKLALQRDETGYLQKSTFFGCLLRAITALFLF